MRVYKHSGNVQQQDFSKYIFGKAKTQPSATHVASSISTASRTRRIGKARLRPPSARRKVHSHLMPSNGMLAVKRQLRRNTVISVSPRLAHAKYGISVTSVG